MKFREDEFEIPDVLLMTKRPNGVWEYVPNSYISYIEDKDTGIRIHFIDELTRDLEERIVNGISTCPGEEVQTEKRQHGHRVRSLAGSDPEVES